jgi:hypothetical protein
MFIISRQLPATLFAFTLSACAASHATAQTTAQSTPVYTNDTPARHDTSSTDKIPAPGAAKDGATDASSTTSSDALHEQFPADGRRQPGLPIETYAVTPGTKFLARLDSDLSTKTPEANQSFRMTTLEPLDAGNGIYLPAGAEIEGHVTRAESAGMAGHAKLWLTFDYLHTRFGKLPIVAEVSAIPGDHSVKSDVTKEGLIEGRSSTQQDAAEAAALAAAMAAAKGLKDKDKKAAAEAAAMAAFTAYLAESGRGHEITFQRGVKFELELERSLYLLKD